MPVGWKKRNMSFRESAAVLLRVVALFHSTRFLFFLVYTAKNNNKQYVPIELLCTDLFTFRTFFVPFGGGRGGS